MSPVSPLEDAHRLAASAEGHIVLRPTADGKSAAELLYSKRKSRTSGQLEAAAASTTNTTNNKITGAEAATSGNNQLTCASSSSASTSEVDSEDDAASIASRLSQIVVEEEGKLTGRSGQQAPAGAARSASDWHSRNSSPNSFEHKEPIPPPQGTGSGAQAAGNTLRPTGARRTNSSSLLVRRGSISRRGRQRAAQHDNSGRVLDSPRPASWAPTCEQIPATSAANCDQLPAIQVERHGEQVIASSSSSSQQDTERLDDEQQTTPKATTTAMALRLRAQSAADVHLAATQSVTQASLRRNGSAGCFGPERGNLQRRPQNQADNSVTASQPQLQPPRQRSNTAGMIFRSNLLDGGIDSNEEPQMLNFCRSTWTLSDFDRTFKKSSDKLHAASAGQLNKCSPEAGCHTGSIQHLSQVQLPADFQSDRSSFSNHVGSSAALCSCLSPPPLPPPPPVEGNGSSTTRFLSEHSGQVRRGRACSVASIASSCSFARADRRKQQQQQQSAAGDASGGAKSGLLSGYLNATSRLKQCVPVLQWLPAYSFSLLWGDLIAGMAVAVLNISTSMSAAVVAGTDFGVAFRASIVNTLVYACLCSSRHTSFGSWSIMSQMLLVSVRRALSDELILARFNMGPTASWAPEEYERWHLNIIIMYTFLIGLIQLVCGLLNLGNIVASFIPEALCSSLITATAFTMAVGQLAHMCGTSNKILFSIERNTTELWADLKKPPVTITDLFAGLFRWAQQITLLVKYSELINLVCVGISIVSVILLCLNQYVIQRQLERIFKRKIFIPSEMILLILMIVLSKLFNLKETYQVTTCGPIEIEFGIPALPDLMLIRELWFESVATALISYTMVYVMAKSYSNKLNYEVDCNQELIACGAGNLVGGLFDALPATASFSRTAGQVEAGGQTQMASIINCVVLVVLAQLLGQHVAQLPICVMAATLFYGFAKMMTRLPEVFTYWRVCKVDFAIWMVTFTAILTLDIVNGFVYGFIFSIFTMLYRAQNRRCYLLGSIGSSPDVYVPLVKYPLAQEIEGISIFQFCGPIHYVCADLFERLLRHKTRVDVKQILQNMSEQEQVKFHPRHLALPSHIILDFSMISYIDSAGVRVIKKIIEDYQRVNITILLASLASHVATIVKREPTLWEVHKDRFYVTIADAVHCALQDCRRQSRDYTVKVIAA